VCEQTLSRRYLPADNRAVLSALNDSVLREFVKLLPVLDKSPLRLSAADTTDTSTELIDNNSVLSQMLCSYSHEMCYVLSRCNGDATVMAADKLCCKVLAWLPHVADVCCCLLMSDSVS